MAAMTYWGSSIDPTRPSIARVYDYLLGGKDNYAVDREIGDVFKRDLPGSVGIAFANRGALTRAVREIATTTGIRQFIDLGSGLPTADNVHQVAQRHAPDSRVVYVDIDPQVLVHGRALLENNDRTRVVAADVRNPEAVRTHPDTLELIDFEQPVAVILSAILHHVNDDEDPAGIVRYWRDHVPSGSYFFISHFRSGNNPQTEEAERVLQQTFGRGRWRTDAEIASLLKGLEILDPGIVPASLWRPDETGNACDGGEAQQLTVWEHLIAAALARKISA
ncbi:SAM-dependent methyltransferase [Streptomyces sp. NPDC020707]|uniref:SAM-dependent methyltransferase n=1 Tax=Streptomyces sp. NPDC020707 TaxID=3365084 RepID=UPI0037B29CF5